MDPTNNSTPNSNPVSGANGMPAMPNPTPVSPAPVNPSAAPTMPLSPVSPTAPAASPVSATPAPAVTPVQPASAIPTGAVSAAPTESTSAPNFETSPKVDSPAPVQGAATANPLVNQNPVNPVFQPGNHGISATDPIMMPEPAKAVDPIEEELKAPMKAAAPAPGSIGSAVSGPKNGSTDTGAASDLFNTSPSDHTRNVSFNDPATQPDNPQGSKTPKGKTNKTTLIALTVVFVIIAIVLVVVLLGQMGVLNFGGSSNNTEVANVTVDEPVTPEPTSQNSNTNANTSTGKSTFMTCTRDMTETELLSYGDSLSGTIDINAEFSNNKLISITLSKSVVYNIQDETADQSTTESSEPALNATVDNITSENAADYYLTVEADGEIDFTEDKIQANYEALDFSCQSL